MATAAAESLEPLGRQRVCHRPRNRRWARPEKRQCQVGFHFCSVRCRAEHRCERCSRLINAHAQRERERRGGPFKRVGRCDCSIMVTRGRRTDDGTSGGGDAAEEKERKCVTTVTGALEFLFSLSRSRSVL